MSVLIKGMEMPKNCENCLFHFEDDVSFEFVHQCLVDNRYIDECDIHQFPYCCPLIPLPSEHGNLIDADAFVEDLTNSADKVWNLLSPVTQQAIRRVCDDIKKYPTIIEAGG